MQVILQILTDHGWVDFGAFFDMAACGAVVDALMTAFGTLGACYAGVAL